ncbi:unnamed protein product [Alopecurus aequalis]
MTGHRPPTSPNSAAKAYARRAGARDPHGLDGATKQLLTYIFTEHLPAFPDVEAAQFASLPAPDGVDRISLLPDALLHNIVSRLFVTEAARTAVLASRWRRVWLSTPLVLSDAYISPSGGSPPITDSVSYILEAHPGPFRCVHLVSSRMDAYQAQLARWLELLAAKGVKDLVLLNRSLLLDVPLPTLAAKGAQLARWLELLAAKGVKELVLLNRSLLLDVPLPTTLFSVTTLTLLFIGLWKFPDVARLPRGTSFPHLLELGICSVVLEDGDIEAVVARSPILEVLSVQGSNKGLRLRLVSQSIRCVQICGAVTESITVVKAPRLDRLLLEGPRGNTGGLCTRVIIGDAPKLHTLGELEPGNQIVETRDVVAGIKASPSTMVTSVKILSLNVCFGNHNQVKMVPTFLRYFPNLETLHILSGKCDFQAGTARLNLKFWELAKPTENVMSCVKVLHFREFRGEIGEVAFLKFFFRSARALESATVAMANPSYTPFCTHEAFARVRQAAEKKGSKSTKLGVFGSTGPEGGNRLSFRRGADYFLDDPFSGVQILNGDEEILQHF